MPSALTLVVGDEELLVARAVSAVLRDARAVNPEVEVRELAGGDLQPGDLADALSPSLFGDDRVVVVESGEAISKEALADLLGHVEGLPEEIRVVVVHAGGQKGKAVVTELLKAAAHRVDCAKITKPSERKDFVRRELTASGRKCTEDAVAALLDAIGNDLRELAGAASQLLADSDGPITQEVVGRYYTGRAEASTFAIADKAVEGDFAGALELFRWAASTGVSLPGVTAVLAGNLRTIGLVASAGKAPAHVLAGSLGMPPWKVERAQKQARGWSPEGLSAALRAVAVADGEVKGEAVDAAYAVERALLAIVRSRRSAA